METSKIPQSELVSTALILQSQPYRKTASQLMRMVQVKPRIDRKPKLRYDCQLPSAFEWLIKENIPSIQVAFPIGRGHQALGSLY